MHNREPIHNFVNNSKYYDLVDSMLNGYAVNEIVLNTKQEPVDYRFLEVNNAFEALTGLKRRDIIGKNVLDIIPQTQKEWIQLCADVALNQKELCTEYYSTSLKRHFQVRILSKEKGIFLTIFNDITSLKQAYTQVEKQKTSYENLFKSIQVGLIRTDIDTGTVIKANPACAKMFGFDDINSFMNTSILDLYKDPQDRKRHRAKLLRNTKLNHTVLQMQKINKKPLTIAVSSKVHYENDQPLWIDSTIQDISKQQRAEERLEINSIVFEHTLEAVVISDQNHKVLTVNSSFSDITGFSKREVLGKSFNLLWWNEDANESQCTTILNALQEKGSWQGEIDKRHKNGQKFPTHLSVIEGEKTKHTKYYISIFYDITYRKQSEEKLYQLAHLDPLTQLSNRHAFMHRLEESVEKAKRYKHKCAIFFMDLDGFKKINDTHGHNAGDEVLIKTAQRLKKVIRKSDMIARMGGDEFTVIIENFSDTRALSILAHKMIETVSQEITLQNSIVKVTTSIGISIYPDDALDLESVLKHADNAMYRAKELGKNNVQFFKKEMNVDSVNQMIFEMELRHALEKDEMKILYKPRVSLSDNTIIGFEAFLSWENETYGTVSPEVFLPVAMQSHLIHEILSWLLCTSLSQVKKWQSQFNQDFILSLSIPDKQLTSEECLAQMQKTLEKHAFEPQLLHLQIQQNTLMQENLLQQLRCIHEFGIKLIIESFGLGVSSLADLYKIPIAAFKIDESFTKDQSKDTRVTLHALMQLAHNLKADVIASGVQEVSSLKNLKDMHCQQGQGPLLYPRKSAHDTTSLLSRSFY